MADGEFTVLVGPSGCGKSTTLRMIAGLESCSGGAILIDGRDVTRLEPKERGLAMVFQDYALYPHMNVAKNMSFALRLARYPKAEIDKRVREVAIRSTSRPISIASRRTLWWPAPARRHGARACARCRDVPV